LEVLQTQRKKQLKLLQTINTNTLKSNLTFDIQWIAHRDIFLQ